MPSHVHLLLFPTPPRLGGSGIAPILRTIKQSSSKRALVWLEEHASDRMAAFRDESPTGKVVHRLWQRGGGYDRNMFTDRAIWSEIDYIHQNPVQEGLCQRADDWEWSSARQFATGEPGPITLDLSKLPGRP